MSEVNENILCNVKDLFFFNFKYLQMWNKYLYNCALKI